MPVQRKKGRYSAKYSKGAKKVTGKYGTYYKKAPFKRSTTTVRRSYESSNNTYNPMVNIKNCITNYAKYCSQLTVGTELGIPGGTTSTAQNNVQMCQFRYFQLSTYMNADPIVSQYAHLHRRYRMPYAWVEITPMFNQSYNGNMGEVVIVPLKDQETILRSGQTNVAVGGTFGTEMIRNTDWWKQINGARSYRFEKPGVVARMCIPLYSFKEEVDNPALGFVPATKTTEAESQRAIWRTTSTFDQGSTNASAQRHYGFIVLWAGWDTSATQAYQFRMRQFVQFEFKEYNVYTDYESGYPGVECKRAEEPWEEDDAKSVSSVAATRPHLPSPLPKPPLKRMGTNINLPNVSRMAI